MSEQLTKLVCLGDSIGTNYKLKVRTNTFSDLLGRRLGLETVNYSTPAATAGIMISMLDGDEKMVDDIRHAKIVLITIGSNNLLGLGLSKVAAAGGIEPSMRMVNKIIDAIKKNPAVTLKMIGAMNSDELKKHAANSVVNYKRDMELLVKKIQEVNPEAIIMVQTLYTLTDASKNPIYIAFSKPTAGSFNEMNEWIKTVLPGYGVLVVELAEAMRENRGGEEFANLKENDFHLSDYGHLFSYRQLYDRLIADHPELACEEGSDVIHERKVRNHYKKEDGSYGSSQYSPIVREIVEKISYEEIKDYDENKQFIEMGVSPMEVYDICREIEKEVYDNKKEIPVPFTAYIRPTYFIDYIEGKSKPSITGRLDTLPHYASAEEKAEAEKDDSPVMRKVREAFYGVIEDDMIVLKDDTTLLGTLDLDDFTWVRVMNRIQALTDAKTDFAMSPEPEKITLKQIADGIAAQKE